MEKIKTTKKYIKANYNYILNTSYGNADYLLTGIEPRYYNAGIYGWNWNGYELTENLCIITGYRNTLGQDVDQEVLKYYENQAKQTFQNSNLTHYQILRAIELLRNDFIKEVLNAK